MSVRMRLRHLEPSFVVVLGLGAILVFLVLYPLFWLLVGSLYDPASGGSCEFRGGLRT